MTKLIFRYSWGVLVILIIFLLSTSIQTDADGGAMIVGPEPVILSETGQNAIVAWNGKEEVLILSIDIKGSKNTTVLRVIPLPNNPSKIEEAENECFTRLVDLINSKIIRIRDNSLFPFGLSQSGGDTNNTGVEITFQQQVGSHDVTVMKIINKDHFFTWVSDFVTGKGFTAINVSDEFKETITNYLNKNIPYFVFDVIDVTSTTQSLKPLLYRFESSKLFFPVEITATSNIDWASSKINLFFITKGIVNEENIEAAFFLPETGFDERISFTESELGEVHPELADLFKGDPYIMNALFTGPLVGLHQDIEIGQDDITPQSSVTMFWDSNSGTLKYLNTWRSTSHTMVISIICILISMIMATGVQRFLKQHIPNIRLNIIISFIMSLLFMVLVLFLWPARWVANFVNDVGSLLGLIDIVLIVGLFILFIYLVNRRIQNSEDKKNAINQDNQNKG